MIFAQFYGTMKLLQIYHRYKRDRVKSLGDNGEPAVSSI